jgi:aromatic ring-opening dioxygenase catalytic subunit (LigB family)
MAGQDGKETMDRRQLLTAGVAVAAALTGVAVLETGAQESERAPQAQPQGPAPQPKQARLPVAYVPHGGGPWPFVDLPLGGKDELAALSAYLRNLPKLLSQPPKALLVISAHWEEPQPTVMTSARPPMLYDYYGFPEEAYRVQWPAPGDPQLAARVVQLLTAAGMRPATDAKRGFDHGTFVPLKVAWPGAEVPTVQLSLQRGLDPQVHLAMGRALAPLRSEGVFIIGSGMSYHNMRGFGDPRAKAASQAFDQWLKAAVTLAGPQRDAQLAQWAQAPAARQVHPREEHLLPLMVIAGAADGDAGRVGYAGELMGVAISAHHFG